MRPSLSRRRAASMLFAPLLILVGVVVLTRSSSTPVRVVTAAEATATPAVRPAYNRFSEADPTTTTTTSTTSTTQPAPPPTSPPRPVVTVAQASAPAIVYSSSGFSCKGSPHLTAQVEQWQPALARYPWNVADMMHFMCIESGGDPYARNPSGAAGLLGVMGGSTDGYTNIAQAYGLWKQRGEEPWTCCE